MEKKYAIKNPEGKYLVSFFTDSLWTDDVNNVSLYSNKKTAEFVISKHAVLKDCVVVEDPR